MTFPWLESVYALVRAGETSGAIDCLFENVDDLFTVGAVGQLIETIDLNQLDTNLLVGVLSITLSRKYELSNRSHLVERVESRLKVLAPDRIEGLMRGLR